MVFDCCGADIDEFIPDPLANKPKVTVVDVAEIQEPSAFDSFIDYVTPGIPDERPKLTVKTLLIQPPVGTEPGAVFMIPIPGEGVTIPVKVPPNGKAFYTVIPTKSSKKKINPVSPTSPQQQSRAVKETRDADDGILEIDPCSCMS